MAAHVPLITEFIRERIEVLTDAIPRKPAPLRTVISLWKGTALQLWTCTTYGDEDDEPRAFTYLYADCLLWFVFARLGESYKNAEMWAVRSMVAHEAVNRRSQVISVTVDESMPSAEVEAVIRCAALANTLADTDGIATRVTDPVFFPAEAIDVAADGKKWANTKPRTAKKVLLVLLVQTEATVAVHSCKKLVSELLDAAGESVGVVTTKSVLKQVTAAIRNNPDHTLTSWTNRFASRRSVTSEYGIATPYAGDVANCNLYRMLVESKQTTHANSVAASLLGTSAHVCFDADLRRESGYRRLLSTMPIAAIVAGVSAARELRAAFPGLVAGRPQLAFTPHYYVDMTTDAPHLYGFRPDAMFKFGGATYCVEFKTVWRRAGEIDPVMAYKFRTQALLQAWATQADYALLVTVIVPYQDVFTSVKVDILSTPMTETRTSSRGAATGGSTNDRNQIKIKGPDLIAALYDSGSEQCTKLVEIAKRTTFIEADTIVSASLRAPTSRQGGRSSHRPLDAAVGNVRNVKASAPRRDEMGHTPVRRTTAMLVWLCQKHAESDGAEKVEFKRRTRALFGGSVTHVAALNALASEWTKAMTDHYTSVMMKCSLTARGRGGKAVALNMKNNTSFKMWKATLNSITLAQAADLMLSMADDGAP